MVTLPPLTPEEIGVLRAEVADAILRWHDLARTVTNDRLAAVQRRRSVLMSLRAVLTDAYLDI